MSLLSVSVMHYGDSTQKQMNEISRENLSLRRFLELVLTVPITALLNLTPTMIPVLYGASTPRDRLVSTLPAF